MLNEAFEALKKYDWGTDIAAVAPIDDAVAAGEQGLEKRLIDALNTGISRDAKDYVCRKLAIVGTAAAVPALARLLGDVDHAHMARFALERIGDAAAGKALCEALATLSGNLLVGAISSLGARRDEACVSSLAKLAADNDAAVARAAAMALGSIGTKQAADSLENAKPTSGAVKQYVVDARLACAEALLAANQADVARRIYEGLADDHQPRLVRLAATRGLLACTTKNA